MAGNILDIPDKTDSLTATTAKSVLGGKAATNIRLKLTEVSTSFDGATSSNAPTVCEFMQSTFGANAPGTNSTPVTPSKRDSGYAETAQGTFGRTWTTEPTTLTLQRVLDVGQFNGLACYMHPFAAPFFIIGGQGAVLRITSPNNVNFSGGLVVEE